MKKNHLLPTALECLPASTRRENQIDTRHQRRCIVCNLLFVLKLRPTMLDTLHVQIARARLNGSLSTGYRQVLPQHPLTWGAYSWVLPSMQTWVRPSQEKVINLIVHKGRCGGDEEGLSGLSGVTQVSGVNLGSEFPLSQPSFSKIKPPILARNNITYLKTNT